MIVTLNLLECQVQVLWVYYVCQTHIIMNLADY